MSLLVFTAAPYGYGPTSKVLCIAEEFMGQHDMVYVGMQPGVSLANNCLFSEVIEITDRNSWNSEALRVLERSELLISALEYRALPLAARRGLPSVFLDTLLWLREVPPPHVELAKIYIAQRFPHPGAGATDYLEKGLHNVGPILPSRLDQPLGVRMKSESLRVLVCVGGLRSPAMAPQADIDYIQLVLALLEDGIPSSARTILALPQYLRFAHLPALAATGCEVIYPTQQQFYDLLEISDILITTPGLEVVYESIAAGVPLVFLPPYNATQLFQARTYASLGIGLHSIEPAWKSEIDVCLLPPRASMLNDITQQVQDRNMSLLFHNRDQLHQLGGDLAERLSIALAAPESLALSACAAHRLLDPLGWDGRERAANAISSVLSTVPDKR